LRIIILYILTYNSYITLICLPRPHQQATDQEKITVPIKPPVQSIK